MSVAIIPEKLLLRPLSKFEEATKIDFLKRAEEQENRVQSATKTVVKDIQDIEQNIVNQVKRHKILKTGRLTNLKKITVNSAKLRAHLLNAFGYTYFKGKYDARKEIENSLGHRIKVRGVSIFQEPVDLVPREALAEFGRRQLVSKAEFNKMVARERARAFTVAGIVDKDMLNSTRQLVSKAVDEGWTLQQFQRGLKEANVKYTGTVFGTQARKGQPLTPFHTETILRTNFSTIYNRGRWNMMNDPDVMDFVPAYEYSAILDERTRETHAAMDGRIYPRDDPIWGLWTPPNGFNCFLPGTMITNKVRPRNNRPIPIEKIKKGTLVLTHLGNWKPVIGLHKKWYNGEIISLKLENGEHVKCTPNHRILTDDGWKEAEKLKLDDRVITLQIIKSKMQWTNNPLRREIARIWAKQNLSHPKEMIVKPEVQRSHECPICGTWVYATAGNYKEHCSTRCAAEAGVYSHKLENNLAWKGGIKKKPYDDGFTDKLKKEIRRRDGNICQLCGTYRGIKVVHHIDNDKMNSRMENLITLCVSCHPKVHYYDVEERAKQLSQIANENEVQSILPGVGICTNPGIKQEHYEGYVYNLSVQDDESYIANQIVSHNCRCLLIPVTSNMTYTVSNPTTLQPDKGFDTGIILRTPRVLPEPVISTPAPIAEDALDNVDIGIFEDGPAQHLRMDRRRIENHDVEILRISEEGKQKFLLQFKETGDDITKKVIARGNKAPWEYKKRFPVIDKDGNHILGPHADSFTKTMAKGARFKGDNYLFEVVDDAAGQGIHALTGSVRLTVDAGDIDEMRSVVRKAFGDLKLNRDFLKIPTGTDEKRLIYNKLMWQYDKPRALAQRQEFQTMKLPELRKEVKETLINAGFKPNQASAIINKTSYNEITNGYGTYRMPDSVIKTFSDNGAESLIHHSSTLDNDALVNVVKNGLMSSKERYDRGLLVDGMSTSSDFGTGGADSVFTRLIPKSDDGRRFGISYGHTFKISPKELGRLDHYGYLSDNYGTTRPYSLSQAPNPLELTTELNDFLRSGNEVMFRKAIGPDAIDNVIVRTRQEADRAIDALRAAGMEEINGKRVEDFVRVAREMGDLME